MGDVIFKSGNSQDEVTRWLDESVLSLEKEYTSQPNVLLIGGVPIGTQGNFSVSIGKAKSKKSFNVSAIAAAALSGETVLCYQVNLPEGKNRVLYVDTEQGTHHCLMVMRRIQRLANLPTDFDCKRMTFVCLRKYTPEQRIRLVEEAVRRYPDVGLVIIDGVRDLLVDINSPTEATNVTSKLMQWTDEYQFHLHTILHQNKSDENARGHIGTELNNKAEAIMLVEKDNVDGNVSKVTPVHTRQEPFPPFAFRINEDGLPEVEEKYKFAQPKIGRPVKEKFNPGRDISAEQHNEALRKIYSNPTHELSYMELQTAIKIAYSDIVGDIGMNRAGEILAYLREDGFVEQRNGKKYSLACQKREAECTVTASAYDNELPFPPSDPNETVPF